MEIDLADLPTDVPALQALVHSLVNDGKAKALRIAQLEARIARLQRLQFGHSSEKLKRELDQLELELDALHEDEAAQAAKRPAPIQALTSKPVRRPLPEHLPHEEQVHEPSCVCPKEGGHRRRDTAKHQIDQLLLAQPLKLVAIHPNGESPQRPPCR